MIPRRFWIAALRHRRAPRSEERIKINAEERRWHEANEAEGGVATANVGGIQEEATRIDHLRDSINARGRVTNRSEVRGWILR